MIEPFLSSIRISVDKMADQRQADPTHGRPFYRQAGQGLGGGIELRSWIDDLDQQTLRLIVHHHPNRLVRPMAASVNDAVADQLIDDQAETVTQRGRQTGVGGEAFHRRKKCRMFLFRRNKCELETIHGHKGLFGILVSE